MVGLRGYYEKHHGVKITDESLKAAVKLSARYIQDRFLPDKAIDLVDEAASWLKISSGMENSEIAYIKNQIKMTEEEMDHNLKKACYDDASKCRTKLLNLKEQLTDIRKNSNGYIFWGGRGHCIWIGGPHYYRNIRKRGKKYEQE